MGSVIFMYVHGNVSKSNLMIDSRIYVCYSLILLFFHFRTLQSSPDRYTNSNDGGPEFAEVFVIVWFGALIVTLNSKLLGGNM